MSKPVTNYRHYIICNMPMKFLLFLIENNTLNNFVSNVIKFHIQRKRSPIETVKYIFNHGILNYLYLAFLWSCTIEGYDYWNNLERKWYNIFSSVKLKL